METAITHDEAEGIKTNSAFADVFMSIHSRTARSFGIIKVNGDETIPTDHPIEFTKRFSDRRFAADVITRGENVRGIKANAESLGLAHAADDVREMLRFTSQARALAGCCLQCYPRFDFWKTGKDAINR